MGMNILVACEESQQVCKAFRMRGHNAFSCDIQDCSGGHPEWHIKGNVLPLLNGNCTFKTADTQTHKQIGEWDLIIAHPPCTHLTSSGQWAYSKGKDVKLRTEAINFFMCFTRASCRKIAIENPIGIMSTIYRKPDQIVSPWMFGDKAEKRTCLWLKGLNSLVPSETKKPKFEYFEWVDTKTGQKKRMEMWMYRIRCISDKNERAKEASKTFTGMAEAMAEQWG